MYSTKEAAEKLRLSQDHVRLLARKGVIPAKRLGHDWVVLSLDYKRRRKQKGRTPMKIVKQKGSQNEARKGKRK